MVNTYTPKLNLAKPANGDVDWHIPVNENWDKIDTELDKALKISGTTIDADKDWNGKSIENISSLSSSTYTSTNVKLLPIDLGFRPKTIRKTLTGSRSGKGTVDLGTFTIPSEYIEGSIIGVEGWVQVIQQQTYTAIADINVKVNGVTVKTFQAYAYGRGLTIKIDFEDYIPIKGNDVISVTLVGYPLGSQYDITGASGKIIFYGEDTIPFICPNPTWS
jgi:hypothetical protein